MTRRTSTLQRVIAGLTATGLVLTQLTFPPRAEAASLGSATASAGSAPPPSVSAIQSFQPDLFTGRATTSIPIAVPPGRKGMQPSLALAYSSSGRNGWVGVGWSLDAGYIERSTKNGVPKYDGSDTYAFMFQGVASELVQIPDGTYRAKDEGLFLKFINNGVSGWEVRDKSGTRYLFGHDVNSQIESGGQIFRWCLDQVIDPNGNSLAISYTKDQGQLYLASIRYTAHEPTGLAPANQVDFALEDRPDPETSERAGFPVTTAKRLKAIEAKATVDGTLALARRYALAYTTSARTGRSLLASITQIGSDGATSLPPTTFTYTQDPPTYLHCDNCVPSISSGNHDWQLQYHTGNLFPRDDGGNDQRLWPSGSFDPGQKCWQEQSCQDVKSCHRCWFFSKCCDHQTVCQPITQCSAIPQVSWSDPVLDEPSGSRGGISWSTDGNGNLSISGPQDSHVLAMTWLYTSTAKTVSLSSLSVNGRADVFYVSPGGSTWSVASSNQVPLNAGWTVVAVSAYNETGSLNSSMSANLASQVAAMNHAQFSPMGISGDFNGDGFADLAHLEPSTNHWHVALNSPSGFTQEQTWLNATLPAQTVPLVGDVDADGKADLILWNSSSGQWQVAKSTGTSFNGPVTWQSGFGAGQTPFMGDFNGDGLLDVGTFSNGTWQIALSTGSSFGSASTWLSSFGPGATPLTGDFNGDGLTDVAVVSGGTVSVALSDGTHLNPQPSAWASSFGSGQSVTSADLNGDGLTDVVYYDKGSGTVVYAPSTGTGFGPSQTLMSEHPFGLRGADDTLQVGDFRGNGISGFGVFNALSGAAQIVFALGTPPDLLTTIANGLGGTSAITYRPSSEFDNTGGDGIPDLPFAIPVVTTVGVSDGMGNTITTSYRYSGAKYDASTREFRGFATAAVSDAEGTTTTTTFSQDLHTKGRPLSAEVRDSAGRLFTKTMNTWSCTEPYPGVHFAKLDQTDGFVYDGDDTFRQVRSRLTYDQYGNVTRTDEDGEVNVSGDERAAVTTFAYNATAWILNKPSLTQTLDAAGTVVAQRRFTYDGAASPDAAPPIGNLTKEEEWLNLPTAQWFATTLAYDAYGNVNTVTDALNRTTTNTYDPTGTYLLTIANTLGYTRQLAYDPRFGQIISSMDQNGVTTTTEYDALGRVTNVIGPNDTSALPTISYEYDLSAVPAKTITHTRIQSGSTLRVTLYAFHDGLGRTIQTRAPAEDPAQQVVSGAVDLNARGLVMKQRVPYLSAFSSSYVPFSLEPSASSLAAVSYTYDAVGRLIRTTDPDGSTTSTRYDDGTVTVTDANGHKTSRTQDAYGRLATVEEFTTDSEGAVTAYTYDALNNLIQVMDAHEHVTQITYDSLGRKLGMDDPDMGHWTYAYDAVDNLTSQTDARGVVISFTYDALNRLMQKSYTVPQTSDIRPQTSVTYTYDNPAKAFSKGKLTEVADGSGSSSFEYDTLGRLMKESKTIDGTTSTVQRSYDLLGRLTSLTSPNGDIATYTYNAQGGLATVDVLHAATQSSRHAVTNVDYNAAGQLTKIAYGSGLASDYTYNPQTLRLDKLLTTGPTGTLQDFSYRFDPIGNVSGITDRVHTATQSFEYDPLNRLTKAVGAYGTLTYAYDPIGNMTSKEGATMTYGLADGSKPHAVTTVHSPQSIVHRLSYDSNGNLLEKAIDYGPSTMDLAAQQFSYDAENRLVEVKTAPEETVTVTFHSGWNFFSLPVIPEMTSVSAILPNFSTNFEQVARFVPASSHFEHYVGNAKFDDFSEFAYGLGYEVYCKATSNVTVALKGKLPTKQLGKPVASGWHLLPALSLEPRALSEVLSGIDYDQILTYDAAAAVLKPATEAAAAQAYYVHVRTAGTFSPSLPRDPTTRFIYDGDGGKVKQITPSGTTLLLGELFERKPDGTQVSYIFAGSQRIASLETPPGQLASLKPARAPTRLAKAWHRLLDFLDIPSAEAAGLPVLHFYLTDHLGSTDLVTDATGAVVEHTEHVPYGAIARHDGPADLPHKFTGQRQDGVNGLILFPARPYDPELGRFIQPDPFVQDPSDPQTLNRYSYVRNNPINFVDPSGYRFSFRRLFAIIAAVVASFVAPELGLSWLGQALFAAGAAAAGDQVGAAVDRASSRSSSSSANTETSSPRGPPVDYGQVPGATENHATSSQGTPLIPRLTEEQMRFESAEPIGFGAVDDLTTNALFFSGPMLRALSWAARTGGVVLGMGEAGALRIGGSTARIAANRAAGLVAEEAAGQGSKVVVIGETMSRVKASARAIGAKWYQAWEMKPYDEALALKRNERWIRSVIRKGYKIVDIGIDEARLIRSKLYGLEKEILEELNYPVTRR